MTIGSVVTNVAEHGEGDVGIMLPLDKITLYLG